ncbi:hypothetical protein [Asticcacaulis machinosus]|uniref:Uncharacterized protein n=1 Tax=Asticcacaulis machinosus TaxID=2984211 RepID=A0ABT5HJS8_9CAUL|nr:hypothetical protein [Asticcacaulis machinosus]MDC7676491.1 hypothetical protein [Asticcacaulis machinosus]
MLSELSNASLQYELIADAINKLFDKSSYSSDIEKVLDVSEADMEAFLLSEYKSYRLDDAANAGLSVNGLSSEFLTMASQGVNGYAASIRELLDIPQLVAGAFKVSPRTEVNLYALASGFKPLLNPFTGLVSSCKSSLGREWYYLNEGCDFCLVSELSQPMAFMGVEGLWVFPQKKLILWYWNGYPERDVIRHVASLLRGLLLSGDKVRHYLATDANRKLAITDFNCPHMGHNFWNVMTGWSNLLQNSPLHHADFIVEHDNQNFFGFISEVFGDLLKDEAYFKANNDEEMRNFLFSNNAFSITVKDENISDFLNGKILAYARTQVSKEFLEKCESLKRNSKPLLLITIRLDNRAWLNQNEGWAALILKLKETFPMLAIVVDGLSSDAVKGWTTGWMSLDAEVVIADKIAADIDNQLPIIFGVGRPFFEGLILCDYADVYIAPLGTGMVCYKWICNKPGIAFSNSAALNNEHQQAPLRVWDNFGESVIPSNYLPMDRVIDVEFVRDDPTRANFTMEWADLHDFAQPLLRAWFPEAVKPELS